MANKKPKVPEVIAADITEMAKKHTKRLPTPPDVLATIQMARAHVLPWDSVAALLAKHYDQWALSKAALVKRNHREGWGL